jgi:hypothetical protein
VREFVAHGEQWQVVRHPSRKSDPSLFLDGLLGRGARVGLLFVSETGERRFLPMTLDDFPTGAEFDRLSRIDLVELLERAVSEEQ